MINGLISELKRALRHPLATGGVFWTLALVFPFTPGVPNQSPGIGLPWRQEFIIAFLILVTCLRYVTMRRTKVANKSSIQILDERQTLLSLTLFALWIAASTCWATDPHRAFYRAIIWFLYLLFFALMCHAVTHPRVLRLIWYALGASLWLLSIICMILFWGTSTDETLYPVKNAIQYFSGFGEMMNVVVPLFAALSLSIRQRKTALLCGATCVVTWLATLEGLQRAPVIAGAVSLFIIVCGMIFLPRCRPRALSRVALLAVGLVFVTLLQIVPSPLTAHKISTINRLEDTSRNDANMRARFFYWAIAREMWREHPLIGVGEDNFEIALPEARARYSANHPDDPLINSNDVLLMIRPHNWFVQIVAELGIIGLALFALFLISIFLSFLKAIRRAPPHRSALLPLGAIAGMFAFLLSSLTSVNSFMWTSGSLLFLFAAALVCRAPKATADEVNTAPLTLRSDARSFRIIAGGALVFALLAFGLVGARAMNSIYGGMAQLSDDALTARNRFSHALEWDKYDEVTHFNLGSLLHFMKRDAEAVPHLKYSAAHGFNDTISYDLLATTQTDADDLRGAEETLALATRVFPRSIFLRVRHADALARLGRAEESANELATAYKIDERMTRGWQEVLRKGVTQAARATRTDKRIMPPSELQPEYCVSLLAAQEKQQMALKSNPKTD